MGPWGRTICLCCLMAILLTGCNRDYRTFSVVSGAMEPTLDIGEHVKFTLRADGNNFPFKQPMFAAPNSTFNANSPLTFGRFTSLRGTYAGLGNSRPHTVLGARIDF